MLPGSVPLLPVRSPQIRGHGPDLDQVLLHLAPAVPQRVVRVGVEGALEGPHAVLEVHGEEAILDGRRRVVEGEQVGKRVGVPLGLLEDPLRVEGDDLADGLGQQMVGASDDAVPLGELLAGEILRVALAAHGNHLGPLAIEVFGLEPGDVGLGDQIQTGGELAPRDRARRGPAGS